MRVMSVRRLNDTWLILVWSRGALKEHGCSMVYLSGMIRGWGAIDEGIGSIGEGRVQLNSTCRCATLSAAVPVQLTGLG